MLLACDGVAGVIAEDGTEVVEISVTIDQEELSRSAAGTAEGIGSEREKGVVKVPEAIPATLAVTGRAQGKGR